MGLLDRLLHERWVFLFFSSFWLSRTRGGECKISSIAHRDQLWGVQAATYGDDILGIDLLTCAI